MMFQVMNYIFRKNENPEIVGMNVLGGRHASHVSDMHMKPQHMFL